MAEIRIRGNKESYYLTHSTDYIDIGLTGDFSYNAGTSISFQYGDQLLSFSNRTFLFQFAEETRGASLDKLILLFSKHGFDNAFVQSLTSKRSTEIGLLKAIFLIYHWIELPLTSPGLSLDQKIYDEFIVDWTDRPEPQKDIYFIRKNYSTIANQPLIEKLIEFNLLATLNIRTQEETYTSYFLPLIKPGVSRASFESNVDPKGARTYNLWKQILRDRDIRLTNWINNRF